MGDTGLARANVEVSHDPDGGVTFAICAKLDTSNVELVRERFVLNTGKALLPAVIVNVAGLTFMDSSGIALLLLGDQSRFRFERSRR